MARVAQWLEQIGQAIVVDLMHQLQQTTGFVLGKSLAREPVEVVARKISQRDALVLAKGHGTRHQQLQVLGLHFLTTRTFHDETFVLECLHDSLHVVALDFDHTVLDRAA